MKPSSAASATMTKESSRCTRSMLVRVVSLCGARSRRATARSSRPRMDWARSRSRSSKTLEIIRQKSVSAAKNSRRSPGRHTRWTTPQRCSSVSAMLTAPEDMESRSPIAAAGSGSAAMKSTVQTRPRPLRKPQCSMTSPMASAARSSASWAACGLSVSAGLMNFQIPLNELMGHDEAKVNGLRRRPG